MLSRQGRKAVGWVMYVGCLLKFFPYGWDAKKFRLKHAGLFHQFIYNIHGLTNCFMGTFAIVRFMIALKFEEFPARIRILNFAWCHVYALGIVCFIQFKLNKRQIFDFANALFTHLDTYEQKGEEETQKQLQERPSSQTEVQVEMVGDNLVVEPSFEAKLEKVRNLRTKRMEFASRKGITSSTFFLTTKEDGGYDWTSFFVLVTFVLLVINPPIHAIMVVDSPCAPHFVSSIGLPCTHILDNKYTLMDKLPFILVETLLTSVFFFNFTFNWTCVFLGLAWLSTEIAKINKLERGACTQEELHEIPKKYRYFQTLTAQMNASFLYYLQFSPSLLMSLVALLTFGAVRYYHLHFTAYMMYPLCGGRCLFEAITNLGFAGMVNQDSTTNLRKWNEFLADGIIGKKLDLKMNKSVLRSCAEVRCKAGSLYTFENTIIIATINNCMQLTFNLLIMYR